MFFLIGLYLIGLLQQFYNIDIRNQRFFDFNSAVTAFVAVCIFGALETNTAVLVLFLIAIFRERGKLPEQFYSRRVASKVRKFSILFSYIN